MGDRSIIAKLKAFGYECTEYSDNIFLYDKNDSHSFGLVDVENKYITAIEYVSISKCNGFVGLISKDAKGYLYNKKLYNIENIFKNRIDIPVSNIYCDYIQLYYSNFITMDLLNKKGRNLGTLILQIDSNKTIFIRGIQIRKYIDAGFCLTLSSFRIKRYRDTYELWCRGYYFNGVSAKHNLDILIGSIDNNFRYIQNVDRERLVSYDIVAPLVDEVCKLEIKCSYIDDFLE